MHVSLPSTSDCCLEHTSKSSNFLCLQSFICLIYFLTLSLFKPSTTVFHSLVLPDLLVASSYTLDPSNNNCLYDSMIFYVQLCTIFFRFVIFSQLSGQSSNKCQNEPQGRHFRILLSSCDNLVFILKTP